MKYPKITGLVFEGREMEEPEFISAEISGDRKSIKIKARGVAHLKWGFVDGVFVLELQPPEK